MATKEKPVENEKRVSRRDFITVSTVSAATIAVAGVGSAIASDRGGFGRPGMQPQAQTQRKTVSTNVANLLSMALAEDDFRQELRNNPEAAARSRGITLSREDVSVLQGILGQTDPGVSPGQRGPGQISSQPGPCPYRGFN